MMISPRQFQYLRTIDAYIKAHGGAPSFQAIADWLGLKSLATVHKAVHNLVDRGYLSFDGRKRTMQLTEFGQAHLAKHKAPDHRSADYHAALQRIGYALKLAPGSDLCDGSPEKKIKELMEELQQWRSR